MKSSSFFWGIALLIIGGAFLLKNFGLIYFDWTAIFRFWPVILILIGISMLPIHRLIKIVAGLLIGVAVLIAIPNVKPLWNHNWPFNNRFSLHFFDDEYNFDRDYESSEEEWIDGKQEYMIPLKPDLKTAKLVLNAGVVELNLKSTSDETLDFKSKGNSSEYKIITREDDDHLLINFEPKREVAKWGNHENEVDMRLNDQLAWTLDINTGISQCDLELEDLLVKKLQLDGGGSEIKLELGDRSDFTEVFINVAASDLEIKLAPNLACELHSKSFLIDKKLIDFHQSENGISKSLNYDDSDKKVVIYLNAAISNLKITRQ